MAKISEISARKISSSFFNRPALVVAKELLGKNLVRVDRDGVITRHVITETEAYVGPQDLASHAKGGRRTKRTEIMFGPAGTIYVYFTYGMHWMLNIVTGPVNFPAAVLIRGVHDISGPARLTKKLGINGSINGQPLNTKTGLYIEDAGLTIPAKNIKRTPRIGVSYAGPIWAEKKYRFVILASFFE